MRWYEVRDKIYEEIQERGYNKELGFYAQVRSLYLVPRATLTDLSLQSYEHIDVLDSAVLIMPLCFFTSANDPRFLSTLKQIMKSKERGGLTENNLVYRYDTDKVDDGTGGGGELEFALSVQGADTLCQRRERSRW